MDSGGLLLQGTATLRVEGSLFSANTASTPTATEIASTATGSFSFLNSTVAPLLRRQNQSVAVNVFAFVQITDGGHLSLQGTAFVCPTGNTVTNGSLAGLSGLGSPTQQLASFLTLQYLSAPFPFLFLMV
jgi:hypothetical protein